MVINCILEEITLNKINNLIKSFFVIVFFSFGSKILGFFREIFIAAKFGSGAFTDAFFIALSAITLFKVMITSSINTVLIPTLSDVEREEGKEGKLNNTNNFLNLTIVCSLIIIAIGWIIAPVIIKIIAHGFETEQYQLTIALFRIGLFTILFSGIVAVFRGYLQSESMFIESAATDFPYNIVYIFFLLFMSGIYGIEGLMIANVIAVGSQILIQIPGLKKTKFKFKFLIDLKNKYVKRIASHIPPILLSVAVFDLNTIIDRTLASTLSSGSVSALNYGNRLTMLVLGIFITPITTILFPLISSEASKGNFKEFKNTFRYGINSILIITIPAIMGLVLFSEPLVKITFERGEFDSTATHMTVGALIFYSLGLVGMALRLFMEKVYYSLQDTKTPFISAFITVVLNIIFNFLFIRIMGHKGLAFATSLATTITSIFLIIALKRKIGHINWIIYIKCGLKSIIASVIMGTVIFNSYKYLNNYFVGNNLLEIMLLFMIVLFGICIYLGMLYILKVEEIKWFYKMVKLKLRKKKA